MFTKYISFIFMMFLYICFAKYLSFIFMMFSYICYERSQLEGAMEFLSASIRCNVADAIDRSKDRFEGRCILLFVAVFTRPPFHGCGGDKNSTPVVLWRDCSFTGNLHSNTLTPCKVDLHIPVKENSILPPPPPPFSVE